MAVDARFLSGANDSVVSTWTNRGTSLYNMTQSDNSRRPLLKIGANGINGAQSVRFDGINDVLEGSGVSLANSTVIGVFSIGNPPQDAVNTIFSKGSAVQTSRDAMIYYYRPSTSVPGRVDFQHSNGTAYPTATVNLGAIDTAYITIGTFSPALVSGAINNGPETSVSGVASLSDSPWAIGATRLTTGYNYFFANNIGCVSVWNSVLPASSAIRKRCVHAAAYSFKIPCS